MRYETGLDWLIQGYKNWIKDLSHDREVYFVTFQFAQLPGSERSALDAMRKEIERFYAVLLTNVIRRPKRASLKDFPTLFAVPDRPVSKRKSTYRFGHTVPNTGTHFHAVLGIPKVSRLKGSDLVDHIRQNKARYLGNHGKINGIHAQQIEYSRKKGLADYAFKHIKRRSFSLDDVLILPKSQSELSHRN
jgi:hypothetical protein